MSSQTLVDYLTKQIFIERNIVTYRSLSRDLRIHVNTAKNELATYHAVAPYQSQPCFATYLICGELLAPQSRSSKGDTEDFDMKSLTDEESEYDGDETDDVPQMTIMLVNERDLEDAVSQFARIDSLHVYSLAPAHIHDAGLLCAPTENVRITDEKAGSEIVPIVGKIVGANIQLKPTKTVKASAQPTAGPSRRRPTNNSLKPVAPAPIEKAASTADITKEKSKIVTDKPIEKLRPNGKLNFAKAKATDTKVEPKAEQDKKESSKIVFTASDLKRAKSEGKEGPRKEDDLPKEEIKRGTKRKSLKAVVSESEDDRSSISQSRPISRSQSKGIVRLQKRTVLSDDDEDSSPHPRMSRMSLRAQDSEAEQRLKAMMDFDDDEVIRVTRETPVLMKEEEEESTEDGEDVKMDDSISPKPKPKKRREKKVIPVGSNGLKKKRTIKSRMTTDAKGYMVTEDYSSYESVDENEEPEPAAPAKGKAKAKSSTKATEQEQTSIKPSKKASLAQPASSKSTKSRSGTSKNGAQKQKALTNFFGASTAKAKS